MNDSHDCQALLAQVGWVRALAQHLTRDAHAADDLAQDAIQAALVRPPPGDRPLQSWLAGIVRNLALHERRSAGSRRARERFAARDEGQPSSSELVERLDSHRAVVDAVGRLEEPYRTAILLRYFEGLSPRAIASRTSVPLRTVHTRLHRALGRLRAELDRAHGGDRRSWLLALIPLARDPGGWSTGAIGTFVMNAKLKVALALVALAGVCSIALWPSDATDAGHPTTVTASTIALSESPPPGRAEPLQEPLADVARNARVDTPEPVAPAPPPAAATPLLSGRVIDVERAPVAGVRVRFFAGPGSADVPPAVTDAQGRFELLDPGGVGRVDVDDPAWASLFRPEFRNPGAFDRSQLVLVVARSVTVAGTVLDEARRPIASAEVAVPSPYGLRARFDAVLDSSATVERRARTDDSGRFELAGVPLFPDAKLTTTRAGYVTDERALEGLDVLALEIVLASTKADGPRLVGHVVDAEGQPVEGARVALGDIATTKTGPGGVFAFEADASPLRAVHPGHLPAELERGNGWPDPLVLHLGGASLTITGRVLDAGGQPVTHADVWSSDETHFGSIEIEGGESSMRVGASVEGILRDDPFTHRVRTDADGRFAMQGLLARDYRVHVLDRRHMKATTVTLAAGTSDATIRLPDEPQRVRVAGRVTSLSGEPIAGVQVILVRRTAGIAGLELDRMEGAPATTDAEGRFAFEGVSRALTAIRVRGPGLALFGHETPVGPRDDVHDLLIAVPMNVHVQIETPGRSGLDRAAVLDASGAKLELSIQHGNSAYGMSEVPILDGRTEVFSVSETGRTLVLYQKGVEVQRVLIALARGGVNTIRP